MSGVRFDKVVMPPQYIAFLEKTLVEKNLGRSRGIADCSCDLSTWRHGIMNVPQWCKAHRLLFKHFASMSQYRLYR